MLNKQSYLAILPQHTTTLTCDIYPTLTRDIYPTLLCIYLLPPWVCATTADWLLFMTTTSQLTTTENTIQM